MLNYLAAFAADHPWAALAYLAVGGGVALYFAREILEGAVPPDKDTGPFACLLGLAFILAVSAALGAVWPCVLVCQGLRKALGK